MASRAGQKVKLTSIDELLCVPEIEGAVDIDADVAYRKSGYSKKFYEAHREEITLHKAAKEAFSALPESEKIDGKLPTVKQLSAEYGQVLAEKKKTYSEYRLAKEEMKTYTMAKHNVDEFLRKAEEEEQHQRKNNRHISR